MRIIKSDFLDFINELSCFCDKEDNDDIANGINLSDLIRETSDVDSKYSVSYYSSPSTGNIGFIISNEDRNLVTGSSAREYDFRLKVLPSASEVKHESVDSWRIPFDEARRNKWPIFFEDRSKDLQFSYVVLNSEESICHLIGIIDYEMTISENLENKIF